jgi:Ca2+-binding EF-hand superfamily protein
MKSIILKYQVLFLVTLITIQVVNCEKKAKSSAKEPNQEWGSLWTELFVGKREKTTCQIEKLKQIVIEEENFLRGSEKSWIKKWGFEEVAYLFDYVDPLFRNSTVKEFLRIYETINSFKREDVQKNYKNLTKKEKIYNLSIEKSQINKAIKVLNWGNEELTAEEYIDRFDINRDGRLSKRELILSSIISNKNIIGTKKCESVCYENIYRKIDALFTYLDCNEKGYINAEDMFKTFSRLKRGTEKYNIYAFGLDDSLRTNAFNDFILKNMKSKQGYLSKIEFRTGILLGISDRQVSDGEIHLDDSRTLKELRWKDTGKVDIKAEQYFHVQIKKLQERMRVQPR